ncbi:hypothetical protein VIGAN_04181200 [Vigna angularis var. angularis]|uniref:Uncharacterized protein n=1 Tax=Vigna angularis var. angularis TaxID=157739 RepID=A0A0S3RUZ3_PHAAN|nr:hypothetical protein VIGAN_04181200 [Vigna angularis var. angularis]
MFYMLVFFFNRSGISFNILPTDAAGYFHIINQMKELITGVGKKAYTLVMGKPKPTKLANFPEVNGNNSSRNLILFVDSIVSKYDMVNRMIENKLYYIKIKKINFDLCQFELGIVL